LLDFGIAKLLNPELSAQTINATAVGLRPMTPEYASPEQVRGEPITTASDVYSLGVLLYELLTGHRPYRVKSYVPREIERVICEEEPEKPSTAISRVEQVPSADGASRITLTPEFVSKTRDGQPEKLRRRLAGDLDTIVLMAMRKEPQRRYASVEQFSEDIRRHLEGLPVIARKPTLGYRSVKFIKRHKVGVMAAALIVLTLLAGIVATIWQARVAQTERARAERRFNDVRKLANSFLFEFHEAVKDLPGSTPARELVVKRALEYLDNLAQEASHDPSLQRELATAYEKVGDVQGNPYEANLGDTTGALQSYRKSLAIRQSWSASDPTNAQARRELATSHSKIGDMRELTGDLAGALESYRQALAIHEALSTADRSDAQARRDLARSRESIGDTLAKLGDLTRALESHRQALAIYEALSAADRSDAQARRGLAIIYSKVGNTLAGTGDMTGALESVRKSLAIHEALSAADPTSAKTRRELAFSYNQIGDLLWGSGDLVGALENYHRALTIRVALSAADPTNVQARRDLATSYGNVGYTLAQTGDATGALGNYRQSLAIFEALSAADPTNAAARRDLAACYAYFGDVYKILASTTKASVGARIERWHEARSWYQRSLAVTRDMRGRGTLRGSDVGQLDKLASEIAHCDEALAKLQGK
jgi:non-specific serine/threonine protein kinase/serine/threonine-protein kinase